MGQGIVPCFAALAFDCAGNKLFDAVLFANEGVENRINAMELKRARRLVGKGGSEVVHDMFEHVYAVNMHVLRFWAENLSQRRRDGAQWRDKKSWLLCEQHRGRFVHPCRLWKVQLGHQRRWW